MGWKKVDGTDWRSMLEEFASSSPPNYSTALSQIVAYQNKEIIELNKKIIELLEKSIKQN